MFLFLGIAPNIRKENKRKKKVDDRKGKRGNMRKNCCIEWSKSNSMVLNNYVIREDLSNNTFSVILF